MDVNTPMLARGSARMRGACLVGRVVLAGALLAALLPGASLAATPQQVQSAIDRAKEYLYAQQSGGNWENAYQALVAGAKPGAPIDKRQAGGATALVVYALMSAGESAQDPRIEQAVDYVRKADVEGTYALGFRCVMWTVLPETPENRSALLKDSTRLKASLKKNTHSPADGFFYYAANNRGNSYDHSVSQIGVLGLAAGMQRGMEISRADWAIIDQGWRKHQYEDGSWSYQYSPDGKPSKDKFAFTPSVSMTAAGVATLFLAQDALRAGEGLGCRGNIYNDAIDRGMDWISENFNAGYLAPYSMYTMARVGAASGHKYLAKDFDWFQVGSDWLVKRQGKDGTWNDHGKVVGTALGLLFLSRGRAPIVMSKLDYSPGGQAAGGADGPARPSVAPGTGGRFVVDRWPWNQRPRDAAYISRWIGRQLERELGWQIVNLDAPVEDLHDAPILYIAGNKTLALSPEQEKKLRTYIEQGGLIVGNADCGGQDFATSFRNLGRKLFPDYEFQALPDNDVILTDQQFPASAWKRKPMVLTLNNGCRSLMLLIPDADASRAWQLNSEGGREELYQLAANIFLYAVDKQFMRFKGETYLEKPDPKIKADRVIKVARLQYPGNYDPEPGGWVRMSAVMHNREKTDLNVETVKLGAGALQSGGYKVAHLTGTLPLKFDAAMRTDLKTFVVNGGTLVVDAAGGSGEFAESAEQELQLIFFGDAKQLATPLKPDHPLYSAGSTPLADVRYRAYAREKLDGDMKHPRLKGIELDGRLAVIYSREDLSVGLVGQNVDGIIGYDPATATALMSKILAYAAK